MGTLGTGCGGTIRSRRVFVPNKDTLLLLRRAPDDSDVHRGERDGRPSSSEPLQDMRGHPRRRRILRWGIEIGACILVLLAAFMFGGCAMDEKLNTFLIEGCFKNGGAPVLDETHFQYRRCDFPPTVKVVK